MLNSLQASVLQRKHSRLPVSMGVCKSDMFPKFANPAHIAEAFYPRDKYIFPIIHIKTQLQYISRLKIDLDNKDLREIQTRLYLCVCL